MSRSSAQPAEQLDENWNDGFDWSEERVTDSGHRYRVSYATPEQARVAEKKIAEILLRPPKTSPERAR